ncbi:hypothetical protein NJB18091_48390 [Mycobacterium marinum]|uniref:hypothetical protein n=1 Tax=Mycobacterium marinum TaxID=1781 RepID=UPI0021C315AA|nr:hypothetical protein [Mycobacterium marinum]GJO06752.1 hypothetical protein NJB18091_48390 [Mycobacterium marinum]
MAAGIESVLRVLEVAGFERLPKPLVVAGSSFDFDAAVKGTGVSHDLVVLGTSSPPARNLVRLLSALSRTLDQVESRRPVSLVLLGDAVDAATMTSLEQNARVLAIDSDDPDLDQISRAIAVLLPLKLSTLQTAGPPPLAVVVEKLGATVSKEQLQFIEAAQVGPEEVRDWLRRFIDAAATGESSESSET